MSSNITRNIKLLVLIGLLDATFFVGLNIIGLFETCFLEMQQKAKQTSKSFYNLTTDYSIKLPELRGFHINDLSFKVFKI